MQLKVIDSTGDSVRAGYACPCGCTPSVEYRRDSADAREGCCCGNEFAVGPDVAAALAPKVGFRQELQVFDAPWGEPLQAAWSVGPSVHGPAENEQHDDHEDSDAAGAAIDPVCGMTVEPESARAKGLASTLGGTDYFFCGKGCKLEFDDDPERYLNPNYVPSM